MADEWKQNAAMGVSTFANMYSTISRDSSQRAHAAMSAAVLENNAVAAEYEMHQAIDLGVYNINRFKEQVGQLQGSARVASASGNVVVNQGSSLDILMDNAGQAARQEEMIRWDANMKAYQKSIEAYNYRYEAAMARASAPSFLDTAVGLAGAGAGFFI